MQERGPFWTFPRFLCALVLIFVFIAGTEAANAIAEERYREAQALATARMDAARLSEAKRVKDWERMQTDFNHQVLTAIESLSAAQAKLRK